GRWSRWPGWSNGRRQRTAALRGRRGPQSADGGPGARERRSSRLRRSQGRVQADVRRRLAQPARLSLRAERARRGLAEDEADVRRAPAVRELARGFELSDGSDGRRDRDRTLVRPGRRHAAGGNGCAGRPVGRRLHDRERALQDHAHLDDEEWNPDLRAPLAAPGVDVRVGDYILSINGQELKAPDNIYRLLDGTANRQTALVVNSTPTMDGARHVTVVPVANEQTLRSRAWVEDSRRLVDSLSH